MRKSSRRGQAIRIGNGHHQHLVAVGKRQHFIDRRHRLGHKRDGFGLGLEVFQVHHLEAELLGQGLLQLLLGDEGAAQGHLAREVAGGLGFFQNVPKLFFVDETQIDEHLAKAAAGAFVRHVGFDGSSRGVLRPCGFLGIALGGRRSGFCRRAALAAGAAGLAAGAAGFLGAGGTLLEAI